MALGTLLLGLSLWGAIGRLHFEAEDDHDRRTLYGTVLLFLLTVPLALTVALELLGRAGVLDVSESIPYDPYLRLAVWAAYFAIFIQIPISIYVVTEQPRKVISLTVANAVLITGLTLWFVVGLRDGAEGALRALAIGSGAMAAISIALSVRLGSLRFSRRWLRDSLRFAAPLIPHSVAQWGLFLADRLIPAALRDQRAGGPVLAGRHGGHGLELRRDRLQPGGFAGGARRAEGAGPRGRLRAADRDLLARRDDGRLPGDGGGGR